MPFTNIWDDTFPPDTQLANLLGQDLRNFRLDTQQRMAAISGLDAAKPNFAGDAQPANWNGILFFATDTGITYQWNNPSWINVTGSIGSASGVKRLTAAASGTLASGQTIWSFTIPSTILGPGSLIQVGSIINGGTAPTVEIQINGVKFSDIPGPGSGPSRVLIHGVLLSNTSFLCTDYFSVFAGNQGVAGTVTINNVATLTNTISLVQIGTGSIGNGNATAWMLLVP
jgi:hypothetical protein